MTVSRLSLALALMLSGCVRNPFSTPAPRVEDTSIVFPPFYEQEAIAVGSGGKPYELDGETLRALAVAANDYSPPSASNPPCRDTQEAQHYRVIRQGDIIFVHIYENPAHCGRAFPALDSGAKYAVHVDGRILRRVLDGQPEGPLPGPSISDTDGGFIAEPGVSPTFDSRLDSTVPDGGTPPAP
ncbi:hypothetical protein P2318_34660 [Myxococcaceae bacterium GXIMD 01537]